MIWIFLRRGRDGRVDSKAKGLSKKVQKLVPGAAITPAFSWAAPLCRDEDGLPFFGEHPQ